MSKSEKFTDKTQEDFIFSTKGRYGHVQETSLEKDADVSERFKENVKYYRDRSLNNVEKNPCYLEGQMTLKCLHRTGDKAQCDHFAKNVKSCRTFWKKVIKDRKRKGIEPALPPVEERAQAREDYSKWLK